jgi:hypothetical protein
MTIEPIAFGGWPNCLRLANEHAELIVTLDVGPRVISYKVPGGENVMKVEAEELGGTGEPIFMPRGGHRFWLAPENERTYEPDNSPIEHEIVEPDIVRLINPAAEPWFIRKELTLCLAPDTSTVAVEHRATNEGTDPATLATWALTVMEPGGLEIIPQPALGKHPRDLLPNRLLVPWPYTDMADERWRWGQQFITLRQTAHSPPTKLGLAHRENWVGYLMKNALFIKTFAYEEGAIYPDFGCNFETFTNAQMLEVETLSPLQILAPGESLAHTETWRLFGSITDPGSLKEDALAAWLAPFLARISFL